MTCVAESSTVSAYSHHEQLLLPKLLKHFSTTTPFRHITSPPSKVHNSGKRKKVQKPVVKIILYFWHYVARKGKAQNTKKKKKHNTVNVVRLWPKKHTNCEEFEVRLLEANDLRVFSQKYCKQEITWTSKYVNNSLHNLKPNGKIPEWAPNTLRRRVVYDFVEFRQTKGFFKSIDEVA